MKRLVLPVLLAAALPAADFPIPPSINAFSADVYKQLAHGDGNLILSPFNIATALSMALAGARGQTAEQMRSVLHLHSGPGYDAALAALLQALAKAGNSDGNELLAANGLWVQKGFAIQPTFESTLADQYHAPLDPVDFLRNADAARARINAWVEQKTKNKIQNLFGPGALDSETRLVLASAIYFYGQWEAPFVPSRTQPAPFQLLNGTSTQTNFMNQTAHFGYTETPSAQILEMRYAGNGIAFDVLLPKTPDGLPDLERSLSADSLTAWLAKLASRNVRVSLPKFRTETAFSLGKTLATMGMPAAFTSRSDFSGISPDGHLAISEVVHKAFVDVSERGTEAAAATGIGIRATAMMVEPQPLVFRADHPFLFVIRDTHSGTILFMGRMVTPR